MTDAELIERLRDWPYQGETMAGEAADRIEQLVAINEALVKERDSLLAGHRALNIGGARLQDRAEAAEARAERLEAALRVARVHVANNAEGWSVSRGAARDDLTIVDAALKGDDHA